METTLQFFSFFHHSSQKKGKSYILRGRRKHKKQEYRIYQTQRKRKNVRVRSFKKKIDKNTQLFQLLEQTKEVKKRQTPKKETKTHQPKKKIKSKIFTSRASLPPSYIILANACWTCRSISRDFWMYSPSTRRAACRSDHF